jgi:hypothetical protein
MMSSKNVLLRSYAISPAVAGLRVALNLLLLLSAIAVRACGTWTAGLPFAGFEMRNIWKTIP